MKIGFDPDEIKLRAGRTSVPVPALNLLAAGKADPVLLVWQHQHFRTTCVQKSYWCQEQVNDLFPNQSIQMKNEENVTRHYFQMGKYAKF